MAVYSERSFLMGLWRFGALFLVAGALALAAVAVSVSDARAGEDWFCPTPPTSTGYANLAPGLVCYGPAHSLRMVRATTNTDSRKAQAGAYVPGGGMYGSWAEAFRTACHSYAGTAVLYGAISHPHSVNVAMNGYQRWGSEPAC